MNDFKGKKAMSLALPVVGIAAFAGIMQANNKPGIVPDSVIPTPTAVSTPTTVSTPTVTFTPEQISNTTVIINLGLVQGMADTGKLQWLSAITKNYPKHGEIIIKWIVPQPAADYPGEDRLIYNRRKRELHYESWWSNFHSDVDFSHVTDRAIHSAGKELPHFTKFGQRVERPGHWINVLQRLGCKLTSSY